MFGHPEAMIDGVRCYLYDCPVHGHVAFKADDVDRFRIVAHPCCLKEKLARKVSLLSLKERGEESPGEKGQ